MTDWKLTNMTVFYPVFVRLQHIYAISWKVKNYTTLFICPGNLQAALKKLVYWCFYRLAQIFGMHDTSQSSSSFLVPLFVAMY